MKVDVTREAEIGVFLDKAEAELGPVDVYVSNAGILRTDEPSWDAAGADDVVLAHDVSIGDRQLDHGVGALLAKVAALVQDRM